MNEGAHKAEYDDEVKRGKRRSRMKSGLIRSRRANRRKSLRKGL